MPEFKPQESTSKAHKKGKEIPAVEKESKAIDKKKYTVSDTKPRTADVRPKAKPKSIPKSVANNATQGSKEDTQKISPEVKELAIYVRKNGQAQELLQALTQELEESVLGEEEEKQSTKVRFSQGNDKDNLGKSKSNYPDLMQVSQSIGGNYLLPIHGAKASAPKKTALKSQSNNPVTFPWSLNLA